MPANVTDTAGGNISHGLLGSLQATPTVQRLRRVSQAGAPSLFRTTRTVTRYEHCVGAAWLGQRAGLPLDAQVTALLHDSTHSAFSHTLDYLVGNSREDTHENHAARLLHDASLVDLLGVEALTAVVDAIVNKPAWLRLLDAVDYTVRDLRRARLIDPVDSRAVTNALTTTEDGTLCFKTTTAAWSIVKLMAYTNAKLYMDPPTSSATPGCPNSSLPESSAVSCRSTTS